MQALRRGGGAGREPRAGGGVCECWGGCETPRGRLSGPRRSCRRSPGRVFSWRGGGGCGCDALSWLRFVMVPETPRPPQLTLRDYHMTEAEGLRAAAASLAEAGARRRGASPPPPPPSRFGRPHPPHSPPARSTQPDWERRLFAGKGAAPGAVLAAAPPPGRDARQRGTGPYFSSSLLHLQPPLTLFPPTSSDSLSLYYLSPRLATLGKVRRIVTSKPVLCKKSQCLEGWRGKLMGRRARDSFVKC